MQRNQTMWGLWLLIPALLFTLGSCLGSRNQGKELKKPNRVTEGATAVLSSENIGTIPYITADTPLGGLETVSNISSLSQSTALKRTGLQLTSTKLSAYEAATSGCISGSAGNGGETCDNGEENCKVMMQLFRGDSGCYNHITKFTYDGMDYTPKKGEQLKAADWEQGKKVLFTKEDKTKSLYVTVKTQIPVVVTDAVETEFQVTTVDSGDAIDVDEDYHGNTATLEENSNMTMGLYDLRLSKISQGTGRAVYTGMLTCQVYGVQRDEGKCGAHQLNELKVNILLDDDAGSKKAALTNNVDKCIETADEVIVDVDGGTTHKVKGVLLKPLFYVDERGQFTHTTQIPNTNHADLENGGGDFTIRGAPGVTEDDLKANKILVLADKNLKMCKIFPIEIQASEEESSSEEEEEEAASGGTIDGLFGNGGGF